MSLSDHANVSKELRRVINNAFYEHHPFRSASGQLTDFILSFHEIRQLPLQDFSLCVDAIREVVVRKNCCYGCYGKGLVYLKLLTNGIDQTRWEVAAAEYERFATARNWMSDFEQELIEMMQKHGVEL